MQAVQRIEREKRMDGGKKEEVDDPHTSAAKQKRPLRNGAELLPAERPSCSCVAACIRHYFPRQGRRLEPRRPNMRRIIRTGGPRAPGLTLAPSAKVFQSPDMTAWAVFFKVQKMGDTCPFTNHLFSGFFTTIFGPLFKNSLDCFKAETSDLDTACCVTPSASVISLSVFPSMQYCRSL